MMQYYDDVFGMGVERGYIIVGFFDQEMFYEELNLI